MVIYDHFYEETIPRSPVDYEWLFGITCDLQWLSHYLNELVISFVMILQTRMRL